MKLPLIVCISLATFLSGVAGEPQPASILRQNARTNAPWRAAHCEIEGAETDKIPVGVLTTDQTLLRMPLFSGQPYNSARLLARGSKLPAFLDGKLFWQLPADKAHTFRCTASGDAAALAFACDQAALDRLTAQGFKRAGAFKTSETFGMFPCTDVEVFRAQLQEGERVEMPPFTVLVGIEPPRRAASGERLYNGIVLPKRWPPRYNVKSDEPLPVPYLQNRPDVVPIDVGRQLFVDDFLVESTDLEREYHHPEKYEGNPVLKPETPLERNSRFGNRPVAAPLGGGVWWNPEKRIFELWYEAGHVTNLAYATSKDGLVWERPELGLEKGTNKVLAQAPDSWSVIHDYRAANPDERYKMIMRGPDMDTYRSNIYTSPDGINWTLRAEGGYSGDRVTAFYNPFRDKWVYSLRWGSSGVGRCRAYWEADDFIEGGQWLPDEPVFWARADRLDKQILSAADIDEKGMTHAKRFFDKDGNYTFKPQLYNLDACAYESLLFACIQIFYGPENSYWAEVGLPKITGLKFAYSRDGFHWDRSDRSLAIAPTRRYGDWDCGYVQCVGNVCIVRGDKIYIYYTGFGGNPARKWTDDARSKPDPIPIFDSSMHDEGAMGVAVLRRDGFASMNAEGKTGTLLTRPVLFSGKYLFVNVDAPKGKLVAQAETPEGEPIAPFTFENCEGVSGDTTLAQMRWKGGSDLTALANRPVRFAFRLDDGKFYAFWVSRDESGRSDGYVAGGGPGFTSDVDTVGKAAYEAEAALAEEMARAAAKQEAAAAPQAENAAAAPAQAEAAPSAQTKSAARRNR